MENQNRPENVPYIVHESAVARMERINKRLWIVLILVICLFVATNAGWIWYESQFVDEQWSFEATTESGGNAIANGNGEVYYYGEGEGNAPEANP